MSFLSTRALLDLFLKSRIRWFAENCKNWTQQKCEYFHWYIVFTNNTIIRNIRSHATSQTLLNCVLSLLNGVAIKCNHKNQKLLVKKVESYLLQVFVFIIFSGKSLLALLKTNPYTSFLVFSDFSRMKSAKNFFVKLFHFV